MPNDPVHDNEMEALHKIFQNTRPADMGVDVAAIIARAAEADAQSIQSFTHRLSSRKNSIPTSIWSHPLTIRSAVLIIAAILVFALIIFPATLGDKIALAQVIDRVDGVRTVQYVEASFAEGTISQSPNAIPVSEPNLAQAIERLEQQLKSADDQTKADLEFELRFMRTLQTEKSELLYVRRVRVKGKQLERTDQLFPLGNYHVVRDAQSGLTVSFHEDRKHKETLTKQVVIKSNGEQQESTVAKISPSVDFFAQFTALPTKNVEQLPSKVINGVNVIGLRTSEQQAGKTWTRTYWVNEQTKLPYEIWSELYRGKQLAQRWVMKDFVYDAPLDDALFSTETPDGYTASEGTIYGMEPK